MSEDVFDSTDAIGEFRTLMQDPAARQAFIQIKESKAESGSRLRYEHILRAVGETPWAIRPAMLGVIVDILAFRAEGGRLSAEEVSQRIGAARNRPQSPSGVAVLPLHGVIVPKAGLMSEVSGATSIEGFRGQFRQAMSASEVSSIVIDVDSPGGMVDQVPEMAAEMRAARGQKPIIAVANAEAASAAYWLASQADQFLVTKSGRVGSIGVFTAHEDESARRDSEGVKTTLVSAGRYKTEGNPFEPLTADAKAHLQGLVNDYYGMFVSDVAKGRGVGVDAVRNGFGEGRVVSAADSVKLGMSDGVGSLEGTVQALLRTAVDHIGATSWSMYDPSTNTTTTGNYQHTYTPASKLPAQSSVPNLFEAETEPQTELSDQPTGLSAEEVLDLETRLSVLDG